MALQEIVFLFPVIFHSNEQLFKQYFHSSVSQLSKCYFQLGCYFNCDTSQM